MALLMFLSTNLFAGQESGGNEGMVYIVSAAQKIALEESVRTTDSRKFSTSLSLENRTLRRSTAAAALSREAVISSTIIIDIEF